jgi:uncharacterized membrane protein
VTRPEGRVQPPPADSTDAGLSTHLLARMAALFLLVGALLLTMDLLPPALGEAHPLSAFSRGALSTTCHQDPDRCFRLWGTPLATCARCVGLHVGFVLLAVAWWLPRRLLPWRVSARAWVLAGLSPMALDVVLGIAWESWDHPVLRAFVGAWAFTAVGLSARATHPRETGCPA